MALGDSALQGLLGRLNNIAPATLGNSYLSTGGLNPNAGKGTWEDFMRQLGLSNIENITDFNSPLYHQYAKFLQNNTPQIGANTLLASAVAGGTSYAGGQNIVNAQLQELARKRQDSINNNVLGFQNNMQGQVQGLLGQVGGSFQATADRVAQQDMANAANSPWAAIGSGVGGLLGTFIAPGVGTAIGSTLGGMAGGSGTAGYKPNASQNPYNTMTGGYPVTWGFGY